jgi:hypothetical protein
MKGLSCGREISEASRSQSAFQKGQQNDVLFNTGNLRFVQDVEVDSGGPSFRVVPLSYIIWFMSEHPYPSASQG